MTCFVKAQKMTTQSNNLQSLPDFSGALVETPKYKETMAKIIDAQYMEPDDDDVNLNYGIYEGSIILFLRDLETETLFTAPLPQNIIANIVGNNENLSSKAMIDFAIALRSRDTPVRVMMPIEGTQTLTEDLIMASNDIDINKQNTTAVVNSTSNVETREHRNKRVATKLADYIAYRRNGRKNM